MDTDRGFSPENWIGGTGTIREFGGIESGVVDTP